MHELRQSAVGWEDVKAQSAAKAATDGAFHPLITIAIPTFNRAALLRDCVRTALAQTYDRFEVLVSDNASTDGTPDVLRSFNDGRLRVVRQQTNIGLLPNWNACLAEARGAYIVFVSDDDRIAPSFLELAVRTMGGRTDIPIVVGLGDLHFTALGQTRPARASRTLETGIHDGSVILREFLSDQITVCNCSVMIHTDMLRARGGFPLDLLYTADVAAWAPLLLQGDAGFINQTCATGYMHDKSETARLSVEVRLADGRRAADIIAHSAGALADSPSQQRLVRLYSRRCFARRNLKVLTDYRKSGGRLQDVLHFLWQFRSDFRPVEATAAVRFTAILLCPRSLADLIRRFRRTVPNRAV